MAFRLLASGRARRGAWLAAALLLACTDSGLHAGPSRPNVLLIVMDTVRQSNLSIYGHGRVTTPRIDHFAEGATVYDDAFAVGAWTVPNHASLFTGVYPLQHGATQETESLAGDFPTLAQILRDAGYQTAAFVNNGSLSRRAGFARGFDHFDPVWRRRRRSSSGPPSLEDEGSALTARALDSWLRGRDPSRPFFVFVNYREAHAPYTPPGRYLGDFAGGQRVFAPRVVRYDYVAYHAGAYAMSDEDFGRAQALYDGEIRYLDARIGAVLDRLEEQGWLDDTLVILTSDHGEEFGEHGLVGHQFGLYDTLLRVPLIVRFPGGAGAGRSDRWVQLVDLYATVLDVTGSPAPEGLDLRGQSLARPGGHEVLFAEYYRPLRKLREFERRFPDFDASGFDRRIRSLRRGSWKFIWSSDGRHELYDLASDPQETHNRVREEPDRAAEMERSLAAFVGGLGDVADRSGDGLLPLDDEELREQLRELGYVE